MPVASGGIHVWHIPALVEIFGDNSCFQFGGGTLGYSWGNAPSVIADRVALEASIQARDESWFVSGEAENQVIHKACKWSPQLATACKLWKKVKFEFEVMDTL